MKENLEFVEALTSIPNLQLRDYFHGVNSPNLCLAENIVVFLRTQKQVLQRRNFESRPHHRYVLILCYKTAGSINVDGSAFHLQPGVAFLFKPYQFHFYMEIEKDSLAWLFITFESKNPTAFDRFANTPIELDSQQLEDAITIAHDFAHRDKPDDSYFDRLTLATSTLLNQIRSNSYKQSYSFMPPRAASSTGFALVEKVNRVLENQLSEAISISQIADTLAISESHLRKRFKSLTGVSLGSHLLHYKLNRAVKLLARSDASLTQISVECGYESLAAFSRSFKSKLSISPSQYRKTNTFNLKG